MRLTRKFMAIAPAVLAIFATTVVIMSGCSSPRGETPLTPGTNSPSTPRPASISPWWAPCVDVKSCPTCSGNNPAINNFPINGLHPGGCWNASGRRLVPGSLKRGLGGCPDGELWLDVDSNGELLGRDSNGLRRCWGAALIGATFTVELWNDETKKVHYTNILISQARSLPEGGPARGKSPLYMLTPEGRPEASLCDAAEAIPWETSWLNGSLSNTILAQPTPAVTPSWPPSARIEVADLGRYALLIRGFVFDEKGTHVNTTDPEGTPKIAREAIPKSVRERKEVQNLLDAPPSWFNIACASNALAKMKIKGLEQGSVTHRGATLKMLTARYCDHTSYTVVGPAIKMVKGDEPEPEELFDSIEARWNEEGAICLSHSRLWRPANTVIPILAKWGTDVCRESGNPVPCTQERFLRDLSVKCKRKLPLCDRERPPGVVWTTYAVDDPYSP